MKDWILKHKKLYFFIVGVVAFIAFMAITLHGVKRASAATHETSVTVPWGDEQVTIELGDYDYYLVIYDASGVEGYADVIVSNSPALVNDNMNIVISGAGCRFSKESYSEEPIEQSFFNGIEVGYQGRWTSLRANYDVLKESTNEVYSPSNPFVKPNVFDKDAPYFSYKDVIGCFPNDFNLNHGGVLTTFYNALSSAEWIYTGKLNNMNSDATSYRTELEFVVELPTFECLDNLIGLKEGVAYYEYGAEKVADRFEDAILRWGEHFGSLDKQVYRFKYPLIIEPSSDGSFHVKLTYADILNYIRYFNEDARTLFNQYSKGHQGLMAMFARIHSVSGHVVTSYPSGQVTGRTTYNEWGSLLYDSCLEVFVDYDKDDENFDSAFDDAYDKGYDSYVGGLKDEILNLQTQLDNYHKVHDAFGNLGSSDIWSGFTGIISGLASFGSSIRGLSVLAGSVFAFFPLAVTGIMSATLLAICVIAIIKAIRG